jgi:hypothetical protein
MPQTAEPRPAVAWMEVLDRLENTLDRSLALATEPAPNPSPAERAAAERAPLRRLDERLAALQAALDQAEANAAEVDALLAAEAERAQRYIASLVASRHKLAEWAARAVYRTEIDTLVPATPPSLTGQCQRSAAPNIVARRGIDQFTLAICSEMTLRGHPGARFRILIVDNYERVGTIPDSGCFDGACCRDPASRGSVVPIWRGR